MTTYCMNLINIPYDWMFQDTLIHPSEYKLLTGQAPQLRRHLSRGDHFYLRRKKKKEIKNSDATRDQNFMCCTAARSGGDLDLSYKTDYIIFFNYQTYFPVFQQTINTIKLSRHVLPLNSATNNRTPLLFWT